MATKPPTRDNLYRIQKLPAVAPSPNVSSRRAWSKKLAYFLIAQMLGRKHDPSIGNLMECNGIYG